MRWLLDANAVIEALRNRVSPIAQRLRRESPKDVVISSIVAHELFYGAFKSRRMSENVTRVDALQFRVVEFDREDARQAGQIRAVLSPRGLEIGPYDVLIAGQAVARGLTLVTHNSPNSRRSPGCGSKIGRREADWPASAPYFRPDRRL
jgi:tRNA(fMet)-specific endonuclease VapC